MKFLTQLDENQYIKIHFNSSSQKKIMICLQKLIGSVFAPGLVLQLFSYTNTLFVLLSSVGTQIIKWPLNWAYARSILTIQSVSPAEILTEYPPTPSWCHQTSPDHRSPKGISAVRSFRPCWKGDPVFHVPWGWRNEGKGKELKGLSFIQELLGGSGGNKHPTCSAEQQTVTDGWEADLPEHHSAELN